MRSFSPFGPVVFAFAAFFLLPAAGAEAQAVSMSLSGAWEIRPDQEDRGLREGWFRPGAGGAWRGAVVPSAWESALGTDFDGVAWYRKGFRVPSGLEGRRVFLRFQGAATEARVWVNGKEVGGHTGAWTPWEVEITSALRKGGLQVVAVRLDEKVGYNTQGFLPIVAPHFGGLWRGVEVLFREGAWIEKDRLFLDGSGLDGKGRRRLKVRVPLGGEPPQGARLVFSWPGEEGSDFGEAEVSVQGKRVEWIWRGPALPWSPGGRKRARLYRLGMALLDGTGKVPAGTTGTARWLIVPAPDAAPTEPTEYFVTGEFSYTIDGVAVHIPLEPVSITVLPMPRLHVKYFHQRDVYADDPFTPQVEPSIPFNLAVMIENRGYGIARNFRITSAQPKIIENEKGLLIDFKIIAAEVAGKNLTPSLTVNFGDIVDRSTSQAPIRMRSTKPLKSAAVPMGSCAATQR